MRRVVLRFGAAFALGLVLVALPVLADDTTPTPASPKETTPKPSFSGYVFVADVVGEVVRSDDKSVTLRITWFQPANTKNTRQHLSQNNRNYRNPFAPHMNHPTQGKTKLKEQHHDYVLNYVDQSLVRIKKLPPKTDENGKTVSYTQKELDELRQPAGFPAYAASKSDLTAGTIVEVHIMRDKTIPPAKATEEDLRIKYVTILGHDPNPPKDISNPKNAKNKNNN
jgi:hypothetical protein